jgi:hypothetical protein
VELSNASWHRVLSNTNKEEDTDERYTPQWVLDLSQRVMGGIDLDPASDPNQRVPATRHFTKKDNGLEKGWSGKVFLNPPFSNTSDWVKHLCIYFHSGAITEAIVLLPVMALSNKSATFLMKGTASAFTLLGRNLSFLNAEYEEMGDSNPFPFALVYCGHRTEEFLDQTNDFGIGALLRTPAANQISCFCSYCGKSFTAKRKTAKFCGTTCRVEAHKKNKLK